MRKPLSPSTRRGWIAALASIAAFGCGGSEQAAPTPTPLPPATAVHVDLDSAETVGLIKRSVPSGQPVRLTLSSTGTDQYSMLLSRGGRLTAAQGDGMSIETRDVVRPGEVLEYQVQRRDDRRSPVVRIQVLVAPDQPPRWEDEGAWLAGEVADRLLRLLYRASRDEPQLADLTISVRRRGDRTRTGYQLTVSGGGSSFEADVGPGGVWLPESYEALARQAILAWGPLPPQPTRPTADLADLLARSPAGGLERAGAEASRRLEELPRSPVTHEEAALVLGRLGLHEAAGAFTDHRPALSRMTAHIAAARALRGPDAAPTPAGRLAQLTLDALTGRQAAVVDALEGSAGALTGAGARAWARAIRIRATGDWRLLRSPARASLLEQLEHYRALIVGRGAFEGLDFYRNVERDDLPDWGRIALSEGANVASGNAFANRLFATELQLAADALLPDEASRDTPEALVAALRSAHESAPGTADAGVVSARMWAAYHERHVLAAVTAVLEHLHRLGMRLEAEEAYRNLSQDLGHLPLFPRVGFEFGPSKGQHPWRSWSAEESCEAISALSRESPDRLLPVAWWKAATACPEHRMDGRLASPEGWFGELYLPGTAYLPQARYAVAIAALPLGDIEELHRLAPWDYQIAHMYHVRIGSTRPESLEASFGPLLQINTTALLAVANAYQRDPEAYRERYGELCDLDADHCYMYAHLLRLDGRFDEVAPVYERAYRHGRDRVAMSNYMHWLVLYYADADVGRLTRAFEIARDAASVGSQMGLTTLGTLLEQTGQYDEAQQVFHRLAERYESGGHELDRFYAAYLVRVGDDRFGTQAEASFARIFPGGLEQVDIDDFDEPPLSGAVFTGSSAYLRQAGLGEGAVVVALDGYRIHNERQYVCVRSFRFDREFELIVYYQTEYRKVRASHPMRSFSAQLEDYPRRQ